MHLWTGGDRRVGYKRPFTPANEVSESHESELARRGGRVEERRLSVVLRGGVADRLRHLELLPGEVERIVRHRRVH